MDPQLYKEGIIKAFSEMIKNKNSYLYVVPGQSEVRFLFDHKPKNTHGLSHLEADALEKEPPILRIEIKSKGALSITARNAAGVEKPYYIDEIGANEIKRVMGEKINQQTEQQTDETQKERLEFLDGILGKLQANKDL